MKSRTTRPRAVTLTRKALYDLVWSRPLSAVAAELGITGNGLAKICDRVLVPYPSRGHWTKAGRRPARAPLPRAPASVNGNVVISAERSSSRRTRTRLSREERSGQLIAVAAAIIEREGVHAATLKRIARECGISEAQAYNYFPHQRELLVSLARRELGAMNAMRLGEINRITDPLARITLSTVIYLRQVSERGALIQTLLNNPEVRAALRAERNTRRSSSVGEISSRLERRLGVPRDLGGGLTAVLTALCLRAGRLLAAGKVPLELAERLTLAIVLRGNRDLMRKARQR